MALQRAGRRAGRLRIYTDSSMKNLLDHNDTATLFFSNKNGQNWLKNSYLKDVIIPNDMLRDLFSMFQNLLVLFFSLQKKVPEPVERNKNSNLSLLSLMTRVSFGVKWKDCCSKRVLKQQESCFQLIRSFPLTIKINR